MQSQKKDIAGQLIEDKFSELFSDPFNTVCYECGRKTRQWVESELAIFLCLYCAGLYKLASKEIEIKCISTDLFTAEQLKYLKNGGNRKFKEFLANYQMQQLIYRERLQTKAVAYYRALLKEEFNCRVPPLAPDPKTGKQKFKEPRDITQMSPGEVLQQMKNKALLVGTRAVDYGEQAYTTVHHKFTSGEIKEDVRNIAQSISNTAKGVWQTLAAKLNQ